ncbi:hypothetical protein [Candidatus Cyanaurora vandensis]|uniref:hypothetical protein n=1 Tax=Candidatus Cyanaurora vandensis TaxID=2714958 RepID=UPI00257EF12E|nr:hypothetical protein [Candidatus Cyanaurora vandensis]
MPYQNIQATLSAADLQEIKTAIATIKQKVPFLIALTTDERRSLMKMGNKSLAFVTKSLNAAQSNPGILPASFDLPGYTQDVELVTNLNEILTSLLQLTEQVDDTVLATGSEAMSSSLTIYDYVKTAAKKQPGLKSIAEELGERFKALGKRRSTTPTP